MQINAHYYLFNAAFDLTFRMLSDRKYSFAVQWSIEWNTYFKHACFVFQY